MSLPVIQDGIPQLVGTVPLRTVSGVHVIFCVCVCVFVFFFLVLFHRGAFFVACVCDHGQKLREMSYE